MANKKTARRALFTSVISLILCCCMLVGTTFAWFTDSVTSANNIIKSGNLDIELEYAVFNEDGTFKEWKDVKGASDILTNNLWEPGVTEVAYFRLANAGSLALKYQFGINIQSEKAGVNQAGETFNLSDHIKFGVVEGVNGKDGAYADRDAAIAAVEATAQPLNAGFTKANSMLAGAADLYLALVVYMPTTVDNVANHNGTDVPEINLGINVFATQYTYEKDSFDEFYDEEAPAVVVNNTDELQAALDNAAYGTTLQLAPGVSYGTLYIRPTAGNGTTMYCETHNYTTTDAAEFKAHVGARDWHATPKYTTSINGVTIIGAEGATVAGFVATSGHMTGDAYDYVRDIDFDNGSVYYNTLYINDLTFKNVAFTGRIDINTSDADSVYDGVTFTGCTFTTGGTASSNGAAIRYYNEANNGKVKNITVDNCQFKSCYQGVYVMNVNGITVTGCTFDTTGHNAIGIQGSGVNLKNVVITGNNFKNIGDRVIRFNEVGADSNITIQSNVAINSGDENGEVMKATSIAAGVTTSIKNNSWGTGKTVDNGELEDQNSGESVFTVLDNEVLQNVVESAAGTDATIKLGTGEYKMPSSSATGDITITGTKDATLDMTMGAYMESANVTIDGVTIKTGTGMVNGNGSDYAALYTPNVTYKNCTFVGPMRVGRDGAKFVNCTFTDLGNDYIWTYGNDVTFEGCTFNTDGKAILIYSDGGNEVANVSVNGCTFNSTQGAKAGAIANQNCAAIEIHNYGNGVNLTTSGNIFDSNFSGEWRIKTYETGRTQILVNGTEYTTIAIDGKTMTIDANKNVTVNP